MSTPNPPATPPSQSRVRSSELSPPSSQPDTTALHPHASAAPILSLGPNAFANANGKRPISQIDDMLPGPGTATPGSMADQPLASASVSAFATTTAADTMSGHNGDPGPAPSASTPGPVVAETVQTFANGYTWSRDEDEPGYSWKNKRAQEAFERASEAVMRDRSVANKYGDPFEMAERELAGV